MSEVWEETIVIPTYELGPEDPYPPLFVGRRGLIHPGSRIVYPYPLQEEMYNRRADRTWRIVYAENEFLRVGVLPELGGRVLSVFDKVAGQEALYRNHVIKYARIGIRGAFFAGGIEWNFPNGHTVTTSSPVDCAAKRHEDGSASIVIGDVERVSRMRWTVEITLHPGCALFDARMRLSNRTTLPNRFWFWANSAAPVSPGMQYRTTATRVSDLSRILGFPVHEGTDISWDKNHPAPQDMFSLNNRGDFGAWYNHDIQRGMVNSADRTESPGLKFFTWGTGDDGGIWEKRLTDEDGFYCEMQSGRFATQRLWGILPPLTEESWIEAWYPIARMGLPDFANREIALSLAPARQQGRFCLGVHATARHPKAHLRLLRGSATAWERTVDLAPSQPLMEEMALEPGWPAMTILVADSAGRELARFVRRAAPEAEVPITVSPHIQPKQTAQNAEGQWGIGLDHEKLGEPSEARLHYEEALRLDPAFSPARVSLSILELRQGLFQPALKRLRAVLEESPSGGVSEEARFHLAAGLLFCARFDEAAFELRELMRSPVFRAGAAYLLGGILLGQQNPSAALGQLEKCSCSCSWKLDALALSACALRKLNRPAEARERARRVIQEDPLRLLPRAEAYFLGDREALAPGCLGKDCDGRAHALSSQHWLELACEYAQFGLYSEAYELLSLCAADDPLVHYHRGYYGEKLGLADTASHYRAGAKSDPAYVFPHRLESEPVLRRALQVSPDDGRAWYYLGNLLASKDRTDQAIACWEEAQKRESSFPVVPRNLGRAHWKIKGDPDRAVLEYRRAIKLAPQDYKLYLELDRILIASCREDDRRKLIESVPTALLENDLIAQRVAAWRADQGDFQGALDIIAATYFYPWEIDKGVRFLYVDCCIGRGIQLQTAGDCEGAVTCYRRMMEYPRNVGVGESRWKANAEAWYRIGLAQEEGSDLAAARASWTIAAVEFRPELDALVYYSAMALRRLGRNREAESGLDQLLSGARRAPGVGAESRYLEGLALKGKGRRGEAQACFAAALSLQPGHRRSRWEQSGFAGE
jgi:tetratricopeptide (TPR) repeat protein